MKKYTQLLIALLFLTIASVTAQELVIEVTTDKYPDETSFKVFNISEEVIFERTEFEKEETHFDTIQLEGTSCYYWTIYDSYSDGMSGTYPGDYKVYLDGVEIAACENPNFGDSISVYNIGNACMANDAKVSQVAVLEYLSKDEEEIKFEIINMGSEVITSVSANFEIDSYSSEELAINDLNIELGAIQTLTFPNPYTFTEAGESNITVTLATVNGSTDEETVNNSASKTVLVLDGIVRKNMVEMTSSAYCGPCYDANAIVNEILFAYDGTWALAKYLLDWGDKKYVPGNEERFELYNAFGAPTLFINGESKMYTTFSATSYRDNYVGKTADIKIQIVDSEIFGDSIFTTVNITPQRDFETKNYLRGVVVERFCTENLKSGAEYYHPAYGYLPNPEGIAIESMTEGETLTFELSTNIKDYPLEDGSLTDMILNFYVQEDLTRIVHQAESVKLPYEMLSPEINFNVEHNADDVNANGLEIIMTSNRTLLNSEGQNITMIKNHFELKKDNIDGVSVPFDAVLNEEANQVNITATYDFETYTTYILIAKDFKTIDGAPINIEPLVFTTTNLSNSSYESAFNIYPNPARNNLNITINEKTDVIISDINGKVLKINSLGVGNNKIDISKLNSGVYFIQFTNSKETHKVKFLKQ